MPVSNDTGKLAGWPIYAALVLKELERFDECEKEHVKFYKEINKRVERLERFNWVFTRVLAVLSPVFIWAIIEVIKQLLSL